MRLAALALLSALALPALAAPSVALQGMMGKSALLVINGGAPRAVAPGQRVQGVKVISTQGDEAVVEIEGQRLTLRVGEAPGKVQGSAPAASTSGNRIILTADSRGHFFTNGHINGRPIRFMVDTGASYVALSESMAQNLGLDYKSAQRVNMATANGTT
ncbi:MAG: TIGR02281 family clan AA aspartic protease, partial [Ottowia sp.]|nr:TIGR02281 family clan AA aspartic protease [Ottowia sp.]